MQHCYNFYRVVHIRFTSFIQEYLRLMIYINVLKEFISVFIKEARKRNFLTFSGNSGKEEKMIHQ